MLNAIQRPSGEKDWSWISESLSCAICLGAPLPVPTIHSACAPSANASVFPSGEKVGP